LNTNQKIALLVFAYSTSEETKYKPFLKKGGLAKSLNLHLRNIIRQSELPVIHFDEKKQVGNNFSSRFANALQDVFSLGYDSVISIGNDSPGLTANHILKAKKALKNGRTVLGPTFDGGLYLLGISKRSFDYHAYLNFSWNTEFLYKEVLQSNQLNSDNNLILEKMSDIDQLVDIQNISIKNIFNSSICKIILSIKAWVGSTYSPIPLDSIQLVLPIIPNKGSPFLYAAL